GSAAFRAGGDSPSYLDAVRDGPWTVERLENLSAQDVDGLVLLVNRWRTRYPSSAESRAALLGGLRSVVPQLQSLVGVTLLDADFDGPAGDASDAAFAA